MSARLCVEGAGGFDIICTSRHDTAGALRVRMEKTDD